MWIAYIACVVLLIMGRDELDAAWIWGIVAFLVLSVIGIVALNIYAIALTVPVVLVDIVLILKVFGSDITIR